MKKILNVVLIAFVLLIGCQDDDVCIEDSSPNLVIKLRDFATQEDLLVDTLWVVYSLEQGISDTLKLQNVDSLQVPLRIDEGDISLEFIRSIAISADKVQIDYTPSEEFVSKACGLKRTYLNTQYTLTNQVLLQQIEAPTNAIVNSNEVHLYLYY